ncbi:MDR family MFS transporter [Ruminiclostridium cellobioparum]|uniref:MDR family MFS transporter n=1 Tax=Ruminiclostridium cellobioparum TaxID=29355 RepID=UPI0004869F08|nr:MDR family MFS transporter [Ruminiclostridium cellobioparum]
MTQITQTKNNQKWVLPILAALIGGFMSILDSSIVNVAISKMMQVFNTTASQIEWVVTVYMLALGVVIPFSGWAGDKFGYKKLYIFALSMFTFGSFLCAVSWSVNSLIISRVIQALGGGLLMPTMMTMVKKIVPTGSFGTAMGIVGVALLIAPALGPTIGGYLVEYVDWKWIFTINIPIGIIGIILSVFLLPKFEKLKVEKLDLGGAVTAVIMLFSLLLALSKGSDWGWTSGTTILLLLISLAAFGMFLFLELRLKNPLLNIRVFKNRNFTAANITTFITTVGLFSGIFFVPLFLQNIKGLGALNTGLIMLPGALVSGLLMPVIGKLYDKTGPKPLAIFGIISLAYTTYMLHGIDVTTSNSKIIYWMVLRGISMAFAAVSAQAASLDSVTNSEVGAATAISNIISRVSGSLGIAALTSILTSRTIHYAAQISTGLMSAGKTVTSQTARIQDVAFVKGLEDVFLAASALTIFGLIPALFLKKASKAPEEKVMDTDSIGLDM